jgi:hypothetical protein
MFNLARGPYNTTLQTEDTTMKTWFTMILVTGLMATGGSLLAAESSRDLTLEPCMNGGVSASGLYVRQAEEDEAFAKAGRERLDRSEQASATRR